MDRKQLVVERTRTIFADRLDDVIHMVRHDRQDLRGWEEPAHVRAVLRRGVREGASDLYTESASTSVGVIDSEFARRAGEPERGQQREGVGQLLEAGLSGLEKIRQSFNPDLTPEERLGVECVLALYGRPAVLVSEEHLASVPPFWNVLEDQREQVEMSARGVGRIELFGHPEYDWAGTAFLVNETTLMTARRTVEIFAEYRNNGWQFRPGISAWMNYGCQYQRVSSAGYRVRNIIGVHDQYDLAFLEVEPPQYGQGSCPTPLALASQPPPATDGRPVYMIGYPVFDARRNEPQPIQRIFRDVYNVKRVQPGLLRGTFQFREVQLLRNDCSLLGCSGGSCIVDLETHQVIGIQQTSRYLETGTSIPLWFLRNDPLFQRAGVTFAEANWNDLQNTTSQLERLARSRFWGEVRNTISGMYQRAFGSTPPPGPGFPRPNY
jgi:hypothetical protein